MSKYEIWITSNSGSKRSFDYLGLEDAEKQLGMLWPIKEKGWTSAFIAEITSSGNKILKTRNFVSPNIWPVGVTPPALPDPNYIYDPYAGSRKQEPKMTIYTVVITDLNGKYLGYKSANSVINLITSSEGVTEKKTTDSIGIAYYNKEGREKPLVKFIDKIHIHDWVKDFFKQEATPVETLVDEWTSWSLIPPPHHSTVLARRYGAGVTEIETKFLPSSFDTHGMEWKHK